MRVVGGSGRVPPGGPHVHERRNSIHGDASPGHHGAQIGVANGPAAVATGLERDTLHEAVARFCHQRPPGRSPLVRLSRGVYLYGNKKLVVAMHNEKLMARIGGGFVQLDNYLAEADRGSIGSAQCGGAAVEGMTAWQRGRPSRR